MRREADHTPPTNDELKSGAVPPLPNTFSYHSDYSSTEAALPYLFAFIAILVASA
jgi:hypothetical protein